MAKKEIELHKKRIEELREARLDDSRACFTCSLHIFEIDYLGLMLLFFSFMCVIGSMFLVLLTQSRNRQIDRYIYIYV